MSEVESSQPNADVYEELLKAFADDCGDAYLEDDTEAAVEEVASLIADSGTSIRGAKSVLLEKLRACPQGDFHVTETSLYRDNEWRLTGGKVVKFDSELSEFNDLKRSLVFHLLPEYHPWGTIRSHSTTHCLGYQFTNIDKYLFAPNALNATERHLKVIDATKLNQALDKAKADGYVSVYSRVFFFIRLWLHLSAQKVLPERHRLIVPINSVDTRERRKDVAYYVRSEVGSYSPLSENELAQLIDHALYWTVKAIPALRQIQQFILGEGVDNGGNVMRISDPVRFQRYLDMLTLPEDLQPVFTPNISYREPHIKSEGRKRKIWDIYWIRPYAAALDSIRNGIFIWVGLITGARKRELSILTEDDILYDEATDEYSIQITRFKTTDDPDFSGKSEVLPLPHFVGTLIKQYCELREIRYFSRVKSLFGSHQHGRLGVSKSATDAYQSIDTLMMQLQTLTGLGQVHCHRLRKTIAEILINRDERNIELIRLLFGHASYAMTLMYIARNPYIVRGVVQAIERNFTEDFADIVEGVSTGVFAGERASKLAEKLDGMRFGFTGKTIKAQIHEYISHRLQSGEQLFIHRTSLGLGTYCLSTQSNTMGARSPCIVESSLGGGNLPNPKNCRIECGNLVLLKKATAGLRQNIVFYTRLLDSNGLKGRQLDSIGAKLMCSEQRLCELETRAASNPQTETIVQKAAT
jgi:integrase